MRLLLDTNAYSEFKRGQQAVADLIQRAEAILMSTIVLGELLYGFRAGSRYEVNAAELRAFIESSSVAIVPVGATTADRFARIAAALREKGRPIPTNDVWIAAHALETGADLVSYDAHFGQVGGLAWINPSASDG